MKTYGIFDGLGHLIEGGFFSRDNAEKVKTREYPRCFVSAQNSKGEPTEPLA